MEIEREKRAAFYGRAKVALSNLRFEDAYIHGTRPLDSSNVDRLAEIFELEGCLRLDPDHYVPAIINQNAFTKALQISGLPQGLPTSSSDEPQWLSLDPQSYLTCLHGRHWLAAARRFLGPSESWWVVDIYSDGLLFLPSGL